MGDSPKPHYYDFAMSSISKAGIFIDLKQLLPFTDQMYKAMSNADRKDYGSKAVQYNLDMISCFTLAFHHRDEKTVFDAGDKHYEINSNGEKRAYVDSLEAAYDNYMTIMDFCFENNKFTRINKRKRRRKHKQYMELMAKIGTGIIKWSGSLYKQVSVSEKRFGTG